MLTRVSNLLLAIVVGAVLIAPSIDKSQNQNLELLLSGTVGVLWILGAIALLAGARIGWWISVLALGVMFLCSAILFIGGLWAMPRSVDPTDGIGFATIMGTMGMLLSSPILIGIVRLK